MWENGWQYVYLGVLIGVIFWTIYQSYMKVKQEGKKFEPIYIVTAVMTALVSIAAIMKGEANITIPDYMVDTGWWGLLIGGILNGIGASWVMNTLFKPVINKKNKIAKGKQALK